MRRGYRLLPLACCVVLLCPNCARPRPGVVGGWELLGQRTVQGRVDRDEIAVGRRDGRFGRIRFEVSGSAMELYDVVVVFANGDRFSPRVRLVFAEDSWSRTIDLPGGARVIRRVTFRYGNLPRGGRARVSLFGR